MNKTVLISGAGIAGPALAYWLSRYGFIPTLIERAPALRRGGYIIDFWGVGFDVAERMHLIPQLKRTGYDVREVRIVNDSGRRVGGFATANFHRALNDRFLSILRGDLAEQIYSTLGHRTETIFGDGICGLAEGANGVTVEFECASSRHFDLVVGADGLHSAVRSLVFGPEASFETYLGYYAASFAVSSYPRRDDDVYVSYSEPGKQVARFTLRDGRTVFFFVFAAPTKLAIGHHEIDAQKMVIHQVFGRLGWECPEILEALDKAEELYFDAVSQIRLERWHHGRVALIGDAAFCPSLLAGQGSSLAMASAYLLAGELNRSDGNFSIAYPAYQNRFKPFTERKQLHAAGFARQFAPKTRPGLLTRNLWSRLLNTPLIGTWMVKKLFADRFALPDYR
jgi:2-polyprenyl-6-methoxyphenol hydroxylase-like FAD-dependent oxidoreductase